MGVNGRSLYNEIHPNKGVPIGYFYNILDCDNLANEKNKNQSQMARIIIVI